MFRDIYKKRFDDIYPEPSFKAMLEERMDEMKYDGYKLRRNGYNRKLIVAAVLIVAMLAATAVAVVQGNLLRTRMEMKAGEEFAKQVQDVHVSGGNSDFGFSVDEILCEGDKMYLSYSVFVPDDGNTYLYALYSPKFNGEAISGSRAYFYDDNGMPMIYAIGGEFGTSHVGIMEDLNFKSDPDSGSSNMLDLKVVFFKSNFPVRYAGSWDDYSERFVEKEISENGEPQTAELQPDSGVLYYCGETKPEHPYILLEFQPDYWENWREKRRKEKTHDVLTPEEFAATGIGDLADTAEISVPLDLSEKKATAYNDVAQHVYEMDGFTLEITDFYMDHLGATFKAEIRTDGEISYEYTGKEPYSQFYALLRTDGTELNNGQGSSFGTGGLSIKWDGTKVYLIDQDIRAIIPVEEIDALLLAPQFFDDSGEFIHYDLEKAIRIEPVFNPDRPESTPVPTIDPAENDDLSS